MSTVQEHEGRKYLRWIFLPPGAEEIIYVDEQGRRVTGFQVDIYQILDAFPTGCIPSSHAAKKLLAPGQRGKGDRLADLIGARAAIDRAIELEQQHRTQRDAEAAQSQSRASKRPVPTTAPVDSQGHLTDEEKERVARWKGAFSPGSPPRAMEEDRVPDWLRKEFEQGYHPTDEPPGMEERYYAVWKAQGGKVTPQEKLGGEHV